MATVGAIRERIRTLLDGDSRQQLTSAAVGPNGNGSHLNGEIFYSLREAQVVIEQWRIHYNTKRSHSA